METVILHAEDDENDVVLLQIAMEQAGVTSPIQVVTDGQQVVNYFSGEGKFADREAYPLPGLVLLDLKLPVLPGLEVLSWMRKKAHLPTPIVVLSSSETEADIASAYRLGANGYVSKPNSIEKLVEVAKGIKDFWLTINRLPGQIKEVDAVRD